MSDSRQSRPVESGILDAMHSAVPLTVLYFGTPVVLISSRNPDGSTNVAPMSSAWWLGQTAVIGMADASQTAANLKREGEGVLNLVPSALAAAVDRLALTTGRAEVPGYKAETGYRHVSDKFAAAGLTPQPSAQVGADRIAECPIQLECRVLAAHPLLDGETRATTFQLQVLRAYVAEELRVPGTHHIDADAWDPLIMKFCDFYGDGVNLRSSRLADAWQMPGPPGLLLPRSA
jgi:flavin reductase (DIM6/NTAB) family NADH-FMN oxidoreductase RutF